MSETLLGGLACHGVKPDQFNWLMPLEKVELQDGRDVVATWEIENGRPVAPAFCGVTKDETLHVCFHLKGEGFYYAAIPAAAATASWVGGDGGRHYGVLEFPAAAGLRKATGEALKVYQLEGLTTGWLDFWQPAIQSVWGLSPAGRVGVGRLLSSFLVKDGFGLEAEGEERFVFFRPGTVGLAFWPSDSWAEDPLEAWSVSGQGTLELQHRPSLDDEPCVFRLNEHVPPGGESLLTRWLPTLNFGKARRSEQSVSESLRSHGFFTVMFEEWEGWTYAEIFIRNDELAHKKVIGDCVDVADVAFDRGGFVHGNIALAATATGRCVRLKLADAHALDSLPRFTRSAPRLEPWDDGTLGCVVLLSPASDGGELRPAKFSLSADKFSVGPLRDVPLHAADRVTREERSDGLDALVLQPAAAAPGQSEPPPVTLLLPRALAIQLWEEWDIAHARAVLAPLTVGGCYREFNEAKKSNLLVILFADVVLLNQALNRGTSLEDTIEKLGTTGDDALARDAELRQAVVSKILALLQMLPGIKQKLELMASMYPYYWVHQEVAWLKAAFGPEVAAGLEVSLRKRIVPIVRREVRTVQGNLGRALAEIEAAARPIDGLLARDEVRGNWTSQARKFLPLGLQGASALTMLLVSSGTNFHAWTSLAACLGSGVMGNVFEGVTRDAEAVNQIGRAAQNILPWWRVFLQALVTTQFEFSQFVESENLVAMKRDRAELDKVPATDKQAATSRLVAALHERILEERRNRFAEVLAGSGVLMASVADDLANAITHSAHTEVAEFIKMFQPARSESKQAN